MLSLYPDDKLKHEQDSIFPISNLTTSKTKIETHTKNFFDSLSENDRTRQDLSTVFNDQDIEFDNTKLTNLDSVTANRNASSENELSMKNFKGVETIEKTILRCNPTLKNYVMVCVGNDVLLKHDICLTKNDRGEIIDISFTEVPDSGGYLLQQWNIKCNDKNIAEKTQKKNLESTKS